MYTRRSTPSLAAASVAPKVALITPMLPTSDVSSAYTLSPAHLQRSGSQGAAEGGIGGGPGLASCMVLKQGRVVLKQGTHASQYPPLAATSSAKV